MKKSMISLSKVCAIGIILPFLCSSTQMLRRDRMMQTISLEFLDRQLEKLTLYTDNKQFTETDLRAAFSEMPEVSVFALMDAVSARDVRRAMDLLARCRADDIHFTVLLALLTRHVRQLWQARRLLASGTPPKGLGKIMGLHPFIAEKLGWHARGFRASPPRGGSLRPPMRSWTW